MANVVDVIRPSVVPGREARLASFGRFSKALGVLAAAGVLVGGCYGEYSYPTGAYPANYRYQTSYVAYPKSHYETRYDYNRWPYYGYPRGVYGPQAVRF